MKCDAFNIVVLLLTICETSISEHENINNGGVIKEYNKELNNLSDISTINSSENQFIDVYDELLFPVSNVTEKSPFYSDDEKLNKKMIVSFR